jgi:mono/diheme cytochrome c family protein
LPILLIKAILAALLLAAAGTATGFMLKVLGGGEAASDPGRLRQLHKAAGFTVLGLLIVLSAAGAVLLRSAGDQAPLRVVLHYHLVLALWAAILLKIAIAGRFRGLLRLAPALGLTMFVLIFVIVVAAAGTYALRSGPAEAGPAESESASGERLFRTRCASCHFADREEAKTGPGLKGLLKKDTLPASGRPATAESVAAQLKRPYRTMPAFPDLSGRDVSDLIAYLKTL